jgi:hypothetical protein
MTHTHRSFRGTEPVVTREISGNIRSYRSGLFRRDFDSSVRLPIASIGQIVDTRQRAALFSANVVEKMEETTRFTRRPEQTSHRAFYGLRRFSGMEDSKLANGSRHKSIGHSSASGGPKKADRKMADSARPLPKEMGTKSKSEKLVCRYCGSDDLAPSFINRRDRRCRKCFSKRYGSATRARKAKDKK